MDEAIVSLATNDEYAKGALALGQSLRETKTSRRLALMITDQVTAPVGAQLASIWDELKVVNPLHSGERENLLLLQRPDLGITFTKLQAWRLTQYKKCVFLDADTIVLSNVDELFQREEFSAAPDVGWPDCFNSGVFVFYPSMKTYDSLIAFAEKAGSFDGGDQGLLNLFWSDWPTKDIKYHLPFVFNVTPNVAYGYAPAFKQFASEIRIIHFIGSVKPWHHQLTSTGQVFLKPGTCATQAVLNYLQQWWDLYIRALDLTIVKKQAEEDLQKTDKLVNDLKAKETEAQDFEWTQQELKRAQEELKRAHEELERAQEELKELKETNATLQQLTCTESHANPQSQLSMKNMLDELLEVMRHLTEADKEGVMTNKVLEMLWTIAKREDCPTDIMDYALNAHLKILACAQDGDSRKMYWLEYCIQEVQQGVKWILPALKLFREVCSLDPKPPEALQHGNNDKILRVVIGNLQEYMDAVRAARNSDESLNPEMYCVDDRFNHFQEVQSRLDFIQFILQYGSQWSRDILFTLWECLAKDPVFPSDREACLKWFSELVEDGPDLELELVEHIFVDIVMKLDPQTLTVNGFRCFDCFFRHVYVNEHKQRPLRARLGFGHRVDQMGIEYLWEVILTAQQGIARKAIDSMKDIYTNLIPQLKKHNVLKEFMHKCFEMMRRVWENLVAFKEGESEQKVVGLTRCLCLLKEYLDGMGFLPHGNSKEQYASVGDRSSHNSSSDSDCVSLQSEGLNIEAEKGLSLSITVTQEYTQFLLEVGDFARKNKLPRLRDSVRDLFLFVPSAPETTMAQSAAYDVVVAVDIGSTFTKVAWSIARTAEQVVLLIADGQWANQGQVPTTILYKPSQHHRGDLEFAAFGREAIRMHSEGEKNWVLFSKFMMTLHSESDFGKDYQLTGSTKRGRSTTVTLPAVRVLRDILEYISDLILDHIRRSHGHPFTREDIKWVLTVPATWTASAKNVMRQAAQEATIYRTHTPHQLAIALEPDSAALHVRSLQKADLVMGSAANVKRYIVIDIGGGTIDLAVHEIVGPEELRKEAVHEIEVYIGSHHGAVVVDKEFEAFLCNLDVPNYPKVFSEMRDNPPVWNAIMANFEASKLEYEGKHEMRIELPGAMFVHYPKETRKILSCLVKEKSPQAYIKPYTNTLHVSSEQCVKWYKPTISSAVTLTKSLHAKHQVDALFVVGGFAKCKILQQQLKAEFPKVTLLIPDEPGSATVKGAVRHGL